MAGMVTIPCPLKHGMVSTGSLASSLRTLSRDVHWGIGRLLSSHLFELRYKIGKEFMDGVVLLFG